jgi:hypothetical protein
MVSLRHLVACSALFVVLCYLPSEPLAEGGDDTTPRLELYVTSHFSKSTWPTIYRDYFSDGRDTLLAEHVTLEITKYLDDELNKMNLTRILILHGTPVSPKHNSYVLETTIYADRKLNMHADVSIKLAESMAEVFDVPLIKVAMSSFTTTDWDVIKDGSAQDQNVEDNLGTIAESLCDRFSGSIVTWIVRSTIKFRVAVGEFVMIDGSEKYDQLGEALRSMVILELTKSDAMWVYSGAETPQSTYKVEGTYFEMDGQLGIHVFCMKRPNDRVVVGRKLILESIDLKSVSMAMTEQSNRIRRVMEMDFDESSKTLAIVALPAPSSVAFKDPTNEDIRITREVARATAQKFRQVSKSQEGGTGSKDGSRRLQVIGAAAGSFDYVEQEAHPSEILADLGADYLALLYYQDLGEQVRLSADLYSFDAEKPETSTYLHEKEVDKTEIDEELDQVVKNLINELEEVGFEFSLASDADRLNEGLEAVKMHNILRKRQIGLRWGAVAARNSPELYFGRQSGTCLEIFFSRTFDVGFKDGGRFDLGYEIVLGIDGGGNYSPSGPASMTLLFNGKIMLRQWQYTKTHVNFVLGGGLGVLALRYKFNPGDPEFSGGDEEMLETAFRPAYGLFAEAEFPIWKRIGLDVVLRYVSQFPGTGEVTNFEDWPLTDYEEGEGPVGRLGGYYFMGGVKYLFH